MEKQGCKGLDSKNVFIVSRPIQYINVLNIPLIDECENVLFIINSFEGAHDLLDFCKKDCLWADVRMFADTYKALEYVILCKPNKCKLFTYSDYGLKLHSYFRKLRKADLYLYEEGLATYIPSFSKWDIFKSVLFKVCNMSFRANANIGGYPYLRGIFVSNVVLYKTLKPNNKVPVMQFKMNLSNHLIQNQERCRIFVFDDVEIYKNPNVLLYVSDWEYDDRIKDICSKYHNYYKILKPHPHLDRNSLYDSLFDYVINGQFIVEPIIAKLLTHCKNVVIVHNSSSAILQFVGMNNWENINLSSHNDGISKIVYDKAKQLIS